MPEETPRTAEIRHNPSYVEFSGYPMTGQGPQRTPIRPYLELDLPPELNGSAGLNRADGPSLLGARNDQEALTAWLSQYRDSPNTFSAYRKEAERLGLWAVRIQHKSIADLTAEDFEAYARFCLNPLPKKDWVSATDQRASRNAAAWRPFQGPLSPTAQRQALGILNSMLKWLVSVRYLSGNPLTLRPRRSTSGSLRVDRYLERPLWDHLKAHVLAMPQRSAREIARYARARWVLSLFYLGGLRISDLVCNGMSAFRCRAQSDGTVQWWLRLLGKGDKMAEIPATAELIEELVRYRQSLGVSLYPSETDDLPLVASLGPRRKGLTRSALHLVVKEIFEEAAGSLRQKGGPHVAVADRLERASAHWLRHTAGTHLMEATNDVVAVRDFLRHSDPRTTHGYLHTDKTRLHEEVSQEHQISWK